MDTARKCMYWLIHVSSSNIFTPKPLDEMAKRGWHIDRSHIGSDKRWFGWYVWIKISQEHTNVRTWYNKSY